MNLLPKTVIAGAVTNVTGPVLELIAPPTRITAQINFAFGSGGTTFDAYLQTSIDNGASWIDIADLHATTSALKKVWNLCGRTPQLGAGITPTDGSLSSNMAVDGILGQLFRVKYTSTGTYAGATSVQVDVAAENQPG